MSSTITTKKLASAFKAASGRTMYVLFEETYESNVHPHTPRWSCIFIGSLQGALRRVFSYASACEGGMLKSRSGCITPEGYIAGWLKELAAPVEFMDRALRLKVGSAFYSTVPAEKADAAYDKLRQLGMMDAVNRLQAGEEVILQLYEHADIVAALYDGEIMAPWAILDRSVVPSGLRRPDLGYTPVPAKTFDISTPNFLKLDRYNHLMQKPDGSWVCAGWEYTIVGSYVRDLWATEIREPGSFRKRIKAYRGAVEAAAVRPSEMKVVIDMTIQIDSAYQRDVIKKVINAPAAVKTGTCYELSLKGASDEDVYSLTHLPERCVSWFIPGRKEDRCEEVEIDLFAA